ncbi:uncharacterized protein BO96DRAFT_329999 [Aspergillus niger CBS 101883]|uniref:Contig An13c0060, genomic contig n=2 Tax=Aspergillus niger TaxID=5061 RepID=A2R1N6_ASPNC|nr:uncharacterized protein BO96DRAFT_329999 [Aspergillus niger CBS 101883]XP_059602084.1 uncharacterized protein An13g01870 [Aspergillus niger]PYH60073.1 hypothetical protein BO96DRAFT_329999 [Aspergillus niger CBS 101883]CAK41586.1 unnamed protein product [Aspergillus niger]
MGRGCNPCLGCRQGQRCQIWARSDWLFAWHEIGMSVFDQSPRVSVASPENSSFLSTRDAERRGRLAVDQPGSSFTAVLIRAGIHQRHAIGAYRQDFGLSWWISACPTSRENNKHSMRLERDGGKAKVSREQSTLAPIAMAVLASSLPPGVSPPLTEDNDHNHNGLIVIVTSLALFLVLASLVIRIFASSKRGLMLQDDHVLFAAAVHYGWGKSRELIPFSDYTQMKKRTKWMVNAIIASCGLWTIVAILLLAIRCNSRPWTDIDSACGGLFPRWQAICALDIVLEAVILAYPAITIRNVQITLSKKLKVLAILNCRIYSSNPTLVGTYATIVAELHLSLSIVLLTVSCLKMFVAVYEDDHGLAYTEDASNSHSRSGRSGPKSWRSSRPVKDLSSFGSSCNEEEPILRTEATVSASSPPLEGHRRNAIMKSVQISVTRESIELGEMAGPSSAAIPRST